MIQGIDIFAARESGLPDLSRITPVQIFNGSAMASLESMRQRYTPEEEKKAPEPARSTVDPITGKPMEVRKTTVVEELLNGKLVKDRGHRKPVEQRPSYKTPTKYEEPPLPEENLPVPESPYQPEEGDILLSPEGPPEESIPTLDENGVLPLPDVIEAPKTAALRRLPRIVLEELKNLRLV
jgi:hypothetical protein